LHARTPRFASIAALVDADTLGTLFGPVSAVDVQPFEGVGFSNAALSRVTLTLAAGGERRLVLKNTAVDADWTARRTHDRIGREALLVDDDDLHPAWEVFDCPYVACAVEPGRAGLLLTDLTAHLLPDVRAPLSREQEDALVAALARLHARFWNAPALDRRWLATPADYCDMLGPAAAGDAAVVATLSAPLQEAVPRGWQSAMRRVSRAGRERLECAGDNHARTWADLPRTLLHGDATVANFAVRPDRRVAAFDWAIAGAGPCTIDIGWYLAVNASRLTEEKDRVLARYRGLLEAARGEPLPDTLWRRLEDVAVLCGARMLLWSKALALDAGRPGAEAEWRWWMERLER
jgi:hypothetical protein